MVRAIDCWVNVTMGEQKPPEPLIRVKDRFEGGDEFFRNLEPVREGVLDKYRYANVERLSFAPRQPRA